MADAQLSELQQKNADLLAQVQALNVENATLKDSVQSYAESQGQDLQAAKIIEMSKKVLLLPCNMRARSASPPVSQHQAVLYGTCRRLPCLMPAG